MLILISCLVLWRKPAKEEDKSLFPPQGRGSRAQGVDLSQQKRTPNTGKHHVKHHVPIGPDLMDTFESTQQLWHKSLLHSV